MSKTAQLDREVSVGDRPKRPAHLPEGFPDTPIMPDPPPTPGEKQALESGRTRGQKPSGRVAGKDWRGK